MHQTTTQPIGVFFGVVTDTNDPDGMGRVQVRLPGFSGDVTLPWVRVAQPYASADFGALILPEVDDNVVVLAGQGGPKAMVVIGSLYSANRLPAVADDGANNLKTILTRGGTEITVDDTDGSEKVTIQTKEMKVKMIMDQSGPKLELYGEAEVNISSDTLVVVTAENVELTATTGVTITGDSEIVIDGGSVDITSSGAVTISGSSIDIG